MKQIIIYFFICSFLLFSVEAVAQTADVTEGCSPLEVRFTAPDGLASYFWDFGNNATSVIQAPLRVFNSPGTYDVTLREVEGGAVIGTIGITVYPRIEIDIAADPQTGCSPLVTQFTNNSTIDPSIDATTTWSFGALGTSTEPSPTFTFNDLGTYSVALSIESDLPNCSATEQFPTFIEVVDAPEVSFSSTPSGSCTAPVNVAFQLTSDPTLTYVWDFGNGATFAGSNPPPQLYADDGAYLVSLTGTNDADCSVTTTALISVGLPAVAYAIPDVICTNEAFMFVNQSASGGYNWDFGDGTTSTEASPSHTYTQAGMYDVTLTVETAAGCVNALTQTLTVGEVDATFIADPTYTCNGEIIVTYTPNNPNEEHTYEWVFADSTTSNEINVTDTLYGYDTLIYTINDELFFETILTVTSPEGCTATSTQTDTIHRPNGEFMPDTTNGCAPLEVVFADSSISNEPIVEWLYDFGDGTTETSTTGDDVTHTFTEPGEYDVTLVVTNELGCQDTSYAIQILVGEAITGLGFDAVDIDELPTCIGDTMNYVGRVFGAQTDVDAWHFDVEGGNAHHCFQDSMLSEFVFSDSVGMLGVSLTAEYNGCLTTITSDDIGIPAATINGPLARISYEIDCDAPYTVAFRDSSLEATSVEWDFGDGNTSTMLTPTHTYADTGDYMVVLTAFNDMTSCEPSIDSTLICIRDLQSAFELDTTICQGRPYILDASPSTGVDQRCFRGITWDIPNQGRPITTDMSETEFVFGTPGPDSVMLITRDINGCIDTATLNVTVYSVTPNFTFDPSPICYPGEVTFTDQTQADTTIATWEWDFGDGTIAEGETPTHTFQQGPAGASLSVTDVLGCDGFIMINIPDYRPTSQITASESVICVGESITFAASDFTAQGSNLTYNWNFGNGQTGTNQTETVTFDTPGFYPVTLDFQEVATGCEGSTNVNVEVQAFPNVTFDTSVDDVDPICAPEIITFTNTTASTSLANYVWDLGDGNTTALENPANNYGAGTYTVSLTATTIGGECAASDDYTFTAIDGPDGNFMIDTDIICNGEEVTFSITDTSNVSTFTWDFGDGTSMADVNPVTHTYNLPQGQAQITAFLVLTSLDGICEESVGRTFTVVDAVADFEADPQCDGSVIFTNLSNNADQYQWNFGDGNTSTDINPTHTYATAGTYTVTLTATDDISGCNDMISQSVAVEEPIVADFTVVGGTLSCTGTFEFQNLSENAVTFEWDFDDGMGTSEEAEPTYMYDTPGTYDVTLTAFNADGTCFDQETTTVTVEDAGLLFMAVVTDPCTSEVQFVNTSDADAMNFMWGFGDGTTSSSQMDTILHQYAMGGVYEVTLIGENADGTCEGSFTQSVNVPVVEIYENDIVTETVMGDVYQDILPNGDTITINRGDEMPVEVLVSDPFECNTATITYDITFVTSFICFSGEEGEEAPDGALVVPNVFTPNNDDTNDIFNVYVQGGGGLPEIEVLRFEVYNRWGQKVYDNDSPSVGWDGRYSGEYVTQDVYIYIIEVRDATTPDGETCVFRGDVTVLR